MQEVAFDDMNSTTLTVEQFNKLKSLFEKVPSTTKSVQYNSYLDDHSYDDLIIGISSEELDGDMPQFPIIQANCNAKFIDNPSDKVSPCFE